MEGSDGEHHHSRTVFDCVEVVRPPLACLYGSAQTLHETQPQRQDGEEGDEHEAVGRRMLPGWYVNRFGKIDMVRHPPIGSQSHVGEREG